MRDCWNRLLQEAKGNDVWTATGCPRRVSTRQALVAEDGSVAKGRCKRELAVLRACFPEDPPGSMSREKEDVCLSELTCSWSARC